MVCRCAQLSAEVNLFEYFICFVVWCISNKINFYSISAIDSTKPIPRDVNNLWLWNFNYSCGSAWIHPFSSLTYKPVKSVTLIRVPLDKNYHNLQSFGAFKDHIISYEILEADQTYIIKRYKYNKFMWNFLAKKLFLLKWTYLKSSNAMNSFIWPKKFQFAYRIVNCNRELIISDKLKKLGRKLVNKQKRSEKIGHYLWHQKIFKVCQIGQKI